MKISKPHYYDQFRCLAGSCPDSCCHEWAISVDEDSARRYLALASSLGNMLRQKLQLDDDGYSLQITQGRCPMWRDDGLCEIQCQLGHDALSQTCRDFPRLRHDYGDFMELGLELSCPEAARLILTSPEQPPVTEDIPGGSEPDYDTQTMSILLQTRSFALDLLRRHPLPQALALLLIYGTHAQSYVDSGEMEDFDEEDAFATIRLFRATKIYPLPDFYAGLEILTDRWRALLQNPHPHTDWPEELRAMARCGIERYWLQAVSDWELTARVKMIVAACILVRQLGGNPIATAQLYSKEIDNDPDNVDAILDAAFCSHALTDANLLALLFQ